MALQYRCLLKEVVQVPEPPREPELRLDLVIQQQKMSGPLLEQWQQAMIHAW